ncbi:hypothetical protein GOP47_0007777 [Adiantum capillus-veneris]|uniref:Uncharacterized protein n=1 Tax=Adiantum capillus-veneris TaxID=13818 RepID=A0A9D4V1K3_ADICA|nr:hypothetical protein GOP47_0007777 [Adiantum capillus-veneris]
MDGDVLPIAHEILAKLPLVREEVELFKSQYPSKPLTFILVNQEKYPLKSPNIAEAFAAARNAKKRKGTSITAPTRGARGDQNERLDEAKGSESAKEKDSVVVDGDTSAVSGANLKKEELKPLGYNRWKWVMPQGLKGVLKILSTLRRTCFANTAKTPKELLVLIQSLAIFRGKEGTDMKSGTMSDDESQDPTAGASMHVHPTAPLDFVPIGDDQKDSPLGQDVQLEPPKEVHSPELQQDVSSCTKRWKDVLMPFPISIVTTPLMEGTPPPTCPA